ncbi:uncharacterized protein LOC127868770 [Dreissena polymorpha]|uniref:uncharacterized protein LOC127868770 n=1 Tax=Dreissena polymorpha TaxID=45954 RepID=UPI00226490B8|nr:uncharacterized protein LOC127868770 [Dreissena polymorpha]
MAKRKITSFFLPTDNNNNDTNESSDLTVESQKKTKLNPSMKTVKKWEKELNIKLKLVVDEDDHVNQMFCEDCVQFMPDQTSSFVTGCTSIKKESVKYHRDSVIHQRGSAKRNREAEEIADLMDTHFTKPERCNGTRWVDHKLRAISKLVTNWKILVMDMMSYSQDDSNAERRSNPIKCS